MDFPEAGGEGRMYSVYTDEDVNMGAGEMAQRLKILTTLAKDPGSVPSTHPVAHNYIQNKKVSQSTPSRV